MVEQYFLSHPWLVILIWAIVYTSDYYLTRWGAMLYKRQFQIVFEGSYELAPNCQKDTGSHSKLSSRFIFTLLAEAVLLSAPYFISGYPTFLYGVFAGLLIIPVIGMLPRHCTNIFMFRVLARPEPGISGRVVYSNRLSSRLSAVQQACMAVLILLVCALTCSPVLLGGGIMLLGFAFKHYRFSRNLQTAVIKPE